MILINNESRGVSSPRSYNGKQSQDSKVISAATANKTRRVTTWGRQGCLQWPIPCTHSAGFLWMAVLHDMEHPTGSYEDLRIKSPFSAELLWVSRTTFCCQHCLQDSFWSTSLGLEAGWKTLIKDISHNRHIRSDN